jgi:acetyl-CoA carboxylase carboxyltransferase component
MSWKSHIDELRRANAWPSRWAATSASPDSAGMGKLTVRERVAFLADPGSFHEVGKIAGKAGYGPDDEIAEFLPATMVFGRATAERPAGRDPGR